MRGHEKLIEMRKQQLKPNIVFVNDYKCFTDWHKYPEDAVTISVDGDVIQALDLRFLIGLKVTISSLTEIRAKALFEKCKAAGSDVVAACHVQEDSPKQTGWFQIYRKHKDVAHG